MNSWRALLMNECIQEKRGRRRESTAVKPAPTICERTERGQARAYRFPLVVSLSNHDLVSFSSPRAWRGEP
jgi:hypothetical protein